MMQKFNIFRNINTIKIIFIVLIAATAANFPLNARGINEYKDVRLQILENDLLFIDDLDSLKDEYKAHHSFEYDVELDSVVYGNVQNNLRNVTTPSQVVESVYGVEISDIKLIYIVLGISLFVTFSLGIFFIAKIRMYNNKIKNNNVQLLKYMNLYFEAKNFINRDMYNKLLPLSMEIAKAEDDEYFERLSSNFNQLSGKYDQLKELYSKNNPEDKN